jgi:hypothetical protein
MKIFVFKANEAEYEKQIENAGVASLLFESKGLRIVREIIEIDEKRKNIVN